MQPNQPFQPPVPTGDTPAPPAPPEQAPVPPQVTPSNGLAGAPQPTVPVSSTQQPFSAPEPQPNAANQRGQTAVAPQPQAQPDQFAAPVTGQAPASPDTGAVPEGGVSPAGQFGQVPTGAPGQTPTGPTFTPPGQVPSMNFGNQGGLKNSILPKLKFIIPAVLVLVLLVAGGFFAMKFLNDPEKIKTSSLVAETADSTSFKKPEDFKLSSQKIDDMELYTKNGASAEDSEEVLFAIGVASEDMGTPFESISQADQDYTIDALLDLFKAGGSLSGESSASSDGDGAFCSESPGSWNAKEISHPNFTRSIEVAASCTDTNDGKEKKAKIKMVIGIKGSSIYMLVLAGYDEVWEKSAEAIDEVTSSFKPSS